MQPEWGVLNRFLNVFNISGPNWLGNTNYALYSICLIVVWAGTGYWMVIFLAALLDIPQNYIDAAKIDGASNFQIYFKVILPLLSPICLIYNKDKLLSLCNGCKNASENIGINITICQYTTFYC